MFIGFEELTGFKTTVADIIQRLVKLKRSEVIRVLALISMFVKREAYNQTNFRLDISRAFLTNERFMQFFNHVKQLPNNNGAVFHHRQIRLAMQLGILACNETDGESDDDKVRRAIGDVCLMINDLLTCLEQNIIPDRNTANYNRWLIFTIFTNTERSNGFEIVARAKSFWFDLPETPIIKETFSDNSLQPFNVAFHQRYGIELAEFYLILFTLFTHFEVHGENAIPLLDEAAYLTSSFSSDDIKKAMAELSQKPDNLAIKLLGTPKQSWATDSSLLSSYPLIEIFEGKHACPDRSLINKAMTEKIYFMLRNCYPSNGFEQIFGFVFEEYIFKYLRKQFYEGRMLTTTFYANPKFVGENAEACDAIIHNGKIAFVIEMKSRLLTTRQKFCGDETVLLDGINDIICKTNPKQKKGVAQLAKNIGRMLDGTGVKSKASDPLKLTDFETIIPVIINYESSINFEAVRVHAESEFVKLLPKSINPIKVGPLLLLGVDAIELLEGAASQHGFTKLIVEFADLVEGNKMEAWYGFREFLKSNNYIEISQHKNSLIKEIQDVAFAGAAEELSRRGSQKSKWV